MHPQLAFFNGNARYFIILLCLALDDFADQGESSYKLLKILTNPLIATHIVKLSRKCCKPLQNVIQKNTKFALGLRPLEISSLRVIFRHVSYSAI